MVYSNKRPKSHSSSRNWSNYPYGSRNTHTKTPTPIPTPTLQNSQWSIYHNLFLYNILFNTNNRNNTNNNRKNDESQDKFNDFIKCVNENKKNHPENNDKIYYTHTINNPCLDKLKIFEKCNKMHKGTVIAQI